MTDRHDQEDKRPSRLKSRFMAWWEGYDQPADPAAADEAAPANDSASATVGEANRWGRPLWTATRLEVAEALWGRGFTTPGGVEHVLELVKPMGLTPEKSVLDVAAGLGGATRAMAAKFGCWVSGLEASPLLVKEGKRHSFEEGLEKKAPIDLCDLERFSYSKRVDAALCKEAMFTIRDKEQFFDGLEAALKPRGQVLITDYVLDADAPPHPAIQAWADKEPVEPHLWSVRRTSAAFAQRNLDLRISEDITAKQRGLILAATQSFVQHLAKHSMDATTKAAVMEEIELWARRIMALEAGLRCYRFFALKPAE